MNIIPTLISIIPGIEVRGSVVYSRALGLGIFDGYILPLIISMLIAPVILLSFDWIVEMSMRIKFIGRILEKTREKVHRYVDKYGFIGLLLFVAIPLPGSGLYTGSLGAAILGMDIKKAIPALLIGNFIAFLIVLSLSSLLVPS